MDDKELIEKLECGCVDYYNPRTGASDSADSGFVNQRETDFLMQQSAARIRELLEDKVRHDYTWQFFKDNHVRFLKAPTEATKD